MLPTMLDNGGTDPDAGYTGIYQELGPNVHPPSSVGANEGCFIDNFGARTYRLPDAVNTRMSDPQYYTQAFLDTRALNCVPVPMLAAFCAWDGGSSRRGSRSTSRGAPTKYPWGAAAPAGYRYAYDDDPKGGAGFEEAFGGFQGAPIVAGPFALTAFYANYNYNYWGGDSKTGTPPAETYTGKSCTALGRAAGTCGWRDYSIYIAPPGRFPTGNSATGHADSRGQRLQRHLAGEHRHGHVRDGHERALVAERLLAGPRHPVDGEGKLAGSAVELQVLGDGWSLRALTALP